MRVPLWVLPRFEGRYWQQSLVSAAHLINRRKPGGAQGGWGANQINWITELVTGTLQIGTHLDGLNHLQIGDRFYNGYRLDAFASTVVNAVDGTFDHHAAGNNFHGLYGGMEKLVPKAVIEPYVLWRLAGKLPANIAGQTGSLGTDSVGAWAGHWVMGYTVAKLR